MKNSLGKFLSQVRILNGFENISEYLRKYPMPLSDAYYRDIESGKKSLSLEKAIEISEKLNLPDGFEKNDIFYHLLSDLLPKEIADAILKPKFSGEYSSFSELLEAMSHDIKVHRQSYLLAKAKAEQTYIGDDKDIKFLNENFDLLPILHYIYMSDAVSFDDINVICKKNGIAFPSERVTNFIDYICTSTNNEIHRKRKIFRIKRSRDGISFKRRFLLSEIDKNLLKDSDQPFCIGKSYESTGIYSIPIEKFDLLREKLSIFLSELDVSSDRTLDEGAVHPFFVSLIISDRNEYDKKEITLPKVIYAS